MQKPKILYRYDLNKSVQKHKTSADCLPLLVEDSSFPNLYRCKHRDCNHDFYGYPSHIEAIKEEIATAKTRIWDNQAWITKLEKRKR